jgi:hypothetical protein
MAKHQSITPHLVEYMGALRCSICKMPFPEDAPPSIEEAFAEHVRRAHRPGMTSEDLSRAAKMIVNGSANG